MNIFVLSVLAHTAAKMHCDKHVVKMILESTQILYTVLHVAGVDIPRRKDLSVYKATHAKHPCVMWAVASRAHCQWLLQMALRLCAEYNERYCKVHACQAHLQLFLDTCVFDALPRACTLSTWAERLASLEYTDELIQTCVSKAATVNPPIGCNFGVVCIDQTLWGDLVVTTEKGIDLVQSYMRYYVYKSKHSFVVTWDKKQDTPHQFGNLFETIYPDKPMLNAVPKRTQKDAPVEEQTDAPAKRRRKLQAVE
jgi:hypothetical protein